MPILGTVLTKAAAAVVVNVFMRNENTEQILRSIILSRFSGEFKCSRDLKNKMLKKSKPTRILLLRRNLVVIRNHYLITIKFLCFNKMDTILVRQLVLYTQLTNFDKIHTVIK